MMPVTLSSANASLDAPAHRFHRLGERSLPSVERTRYDLAGNCALKRSNFREGFRGDDEIDGLGEMHIACRGHLRMGGSKCGAHHDIQISKDSSVLERKDESRLTRS